MYAKQVVIENETGLHAPSGFRFHKHLRTNSGVKFLYRIWIGGQATARRMQNQLLC